MNTAGAPAAEAVVRASVDAGVEDGTTPGAAALVVARGGKRLLHASGGLHRGPRPPRVDERTVFDLASLTKMLSTTLLAARAVDERKVALDEQPWAQRWPGVTVEHVLRHDSGLPAWRGLFRVSLPGTPSAAKAVVEGALAVEPEAPAGARTLYSDIGIIALGALLEERFGAPLDDVFQDTARAAYGAACGLRFVRLTAHGFHPSSPDAVAPTERCLWRRRAIQGQVHDENCFAMGGVSGHAGLFGNLLDVERAAGFFLGAMTPTLRAFARVPDAPARRPIGFDRASAGGSTGDALSASTFGHLAFTGCSLWIDPDAGAFYALLTNRIHETRDHPEKILAMRKAFHRAAAAFVAAA